MNKLLQMLYGNMMDETTGGDGGAGGSNPPAGNPMGNAGEADYLADPPGDTPPAAVPPVVDPNKPAPNLSLDDGKGLLDDKANDDPNKKPADDTPPPPTDADYKFELPEGFELADDVKQSVIDLAKEANVSPEVANKFVQKHAELKQQELSNAKATIESWRQETIADPEVGGQYIQQTMKNVNAALAVPHGAEVAEILKQTGLQNHPAMVKFLNQYGKMIKTDSNRGVSPVTAVSDKQKIDSFYGND